MVIYKYTLFLWKYSSSRIGSLSESHSQGKKTELYEGEILYV